MNAPDQMDNRMKKYQSLYAWMIGLFAIVQVSIFYYYWPRFTTQTWEIHFHYWLVTAWYLMLIIQPYLISRGNIQRHRTLGIIGFVLAGGVIFTGMSLLDVPLKLAEAHDPTRPGPPISFYYGTLIIESVSMLAFGFAILKSILHRKEIHEHSWWLIAGAFYMMPPALGRGMIVFWRRMLPPENFKPLFALVSTELIYLGLFLWFASRFGKFRHAATAIGLLLIVFRMLRVPMGASEAIQEFLHNWIQWR